jgi:hypothetical protein
MRLGGPDDASRGETGQLSSNFCHRRRRLTLSICRFVGPARGGTPLVCEPPDLGSAVAVSACDSLRCVITVQLEIVPDPDDDALALPFVEATMGGVVVRALLDSGATRSSVRRRPGVIGSGRGAAGRGAFGASQLRDVVELPVEFAGHDLGVMEVRVVPSDHPGHGDLLGQDVLSRYRCEYRLGEGILILDGDAATPRQQVFLDQGSHVYAEAQWPSGETAQGVLDTGASVTVVDSGFVGTHPDLFVPNGLSEGMDATGETVSTRMMTMAPMTLLGSPFGASAVAVVDLSVANADMERPMDLIVGWPILSQGTFYVDHAARTASHRY